MARFQWLSLLPLALFTSLGCGDGDPGPGDLPPTTLSVEVGNDFFRSSPNGSTDPAVDTVSVNGTATWIWIDEGDHGVAFDDPDLPISDVMSVIGSQHSVTFPSAGTFAYSCQVHGPQMAGTVVVR